MLKNCLSIGEIPSIPQLPLKSMPPADQIILCDWRDNYGQSVPQVTVRNWSTIARKIMLALYPCHTPSQRQHLNH